MESAKLNLEIFALWLATGTRLGGDRPPANQNWARQGDGRIAIEGVESCCLPASVRSGHISWTRFLFAPRIPPRCGS